MSLSPGDVSPGQDAFLRFLREEVPRNWHLYCDAVSDNFRVISPKDFRILASAGYTIGGVYAVINHAGIA